MYKEEYSFIEYSINNKRHRFHKLTDKNIYKPTDKDVFKSIFFHSKDLKKYFNETFNEEGKNTLSGYNKPISADYLTLDIDNQDLNVSQETARNFL